MVDYSIAALLKIGFVYLIAIIVFGWLAIYFPIRPLLKRLHSRNLGGTNWEARAGDWLGFLERVLYIITIGSGVYAFVPVWLVLKVSANWKSWTEATPKYHYSAFLIGSALSLIMGILGALMVRILINLSSI